METTTVPDEHPADGKSETGENPPSEKLQITFAKFLEDVPPTQSRNIKDLVGLKRPPSAYASWYEMTTPPLTLHCSSEHCRGIRIFRARKDGPSITEEFKNVYIEYVCSNCKTKMKIFALRARRDESDASAGICYKFGELPEFGEPTPARLLRIIGTKDRELFLKGRRCENNGIGIGAFTYYRRVIENQKNKIIDEIIKVAAKLGPSADIIKSLTAAKEEKQFSKAVESIKETLPQVLLINGHNPLTLLHDALSKGLHVKTDEECLAVAQAIRRVLVELAERIGIALKDEAGLAEALSTILNQK